MKRIFLLLVITLLLQPQIGSALSPEQRRVIDANIKYVNTETGCAAPSSVNLSGSSYGTDTTGGETSIQKVNPAPFSGAAITPTAVMLHWTGGNPNQSVEDFVSGISSRGLSVQLYIDGSGNVYQLVDDLATHTSHAGDANSKSIGIEIAAGSDGTVETAEAEIKGNTIQKQAVARTVAYLVQTYNMQADPDIAGLKGILSHHQVDPGRKSDVGDTYQADIINAVKNGGQLTFSNNNGCTPTGSAGQGGDPDANKILGQHMAAEKGWTGNEWACLLDLWTRESGWNHTADNPVSSAYGIPQAMVSAHRKDLNDNYPGYYDSETPDPNTPGTFDYTGGDPAVQIKWGLKYIEGRYRTPCAAVAFWDANGHY